MKILFLDDNQERQESFSRRYPHAEQTRTAKATIHQLTMRRTWGLVCLDHDLGGEIWVPNWREETGSGVVRHMVNRKRKFPVRLVLVHTFNTVEGPKMVDDLRRAGYDASYTPFGRVLFEAVDAFTKA